MRKVLIVLLCTFMLAAWSSSCTRRVYVPVEKERVVRDTVAVERVRVDTVVNRDSVIVRQAGDTVFVDRWHQRWRLRDITDTLRLTERDTVTVPQPYPVEKKVKAEPSAWQKTVTAFGYVFMGLLAAALGLGVYAAVRRRRG